MFYLFFVLLAVAVPSARAEVYIQGPDISHQLYLQRVHEDPDATAFADWWLHDRKNKMEPQMVIADFEHAERIFLSAELKEAYSLYLNLAGRRHRFDWPLGARKKIFSALLRLAMTESQAEAKSRWLAEAIAFDPLLEPDAEVFPPPLIEEFSSLRQSTAGTKISTRGWPQSAHTILINGREVPRTAEVTIPSRPFRMTLVSDQNFPMSQVIDPHSLAAAQVQWTAQALVTGQCLQPHWTRPQDQYPRKHKVIFADTCDLPVQGREENLPAISEIVTARSPKPSTSVWKNKWLWIGLGTVISGALLYDHLRAQNSSPSAREGF